LRMEANFSFRGGALIKLPFIHKVAETNKAVNSD